MPKGHEGQTCTEAIRAMIGAGDVVSFSELRKLLQAKGSWKDDTILQHLMSLVVNLPPAREHWKTTVPFLFLRPDGQYEVFDESKHPKTIS